MKYSKRYIAFTIVLALVFILKFQILGVDNAQVGRFRGGELDTQVWNPMVAKEVNGQTIHAVIDNQTAVHILCVSLEYTSVCDRHCETISPGFHCEHK